MKTSVSAILAAAALALTVPHSGQAFSTNSGMKVNPVNTAVFEAVGKGGNKASEFWCAAGDYASRQMGASGRTKIYIARSRGPSETTDRKSAVQFTLDPTAAGVTPTAGSLSLNTLTVGESLSVQDAYGYCLVHPGRP